MLEGLNCGGRDEDEQVAAWAKQGSTNRQVFAAPFFILWGGWVVICVTRYNSRRSQHVVLSSVTTEPRGSNDKTPE